MTVGAIVSIAGTAVNLGLGAYSTITQLDLAKEQAELQEDLLLRKFDLEQELAEAQRRIVEIQGEGIAERQAIELSLVEAQAESARKELERINLIADMKTGLDVLKLQRQADMLNNPIVVNENNNIRPVIETTGNIVPTAIDPIPQKESKTNPLALFAITTVGLYALSKVISR